MDDDVLGRFDPVVADWFRSSVGDPSDVQAEAWPAIDSGTNVLAIAPTGSGKTLAAFLVALDRLLTGNYPPGVLSVLYISPLKALNTDISRNLIAPLEALRSRFAEAGRTVPSIRVATRSGDTDAAARRAFLSSPPEILATTPESFALLLNSPRARDRLSTIRLVVLDEVHALLPTKRGAFLACQLERLVLLAGEFQRVALSATVPDAAAAAFFACGSRSGPAGEPVPRPVRIVAPAGRKTIALSVVYPGRQDPIPASAATESPSRWGALIEAFRSAADRNRTTLIFVNSRRNAEKIAFLLNENGPEIAWAHHGSLSREVRSAVEERLKNGSLPIVVATSSLELGIDIGSIDEVILAGTPGSVSASLQRIGRAGHRLGAESRARLYPFHGWDLLLAAAQSPSISAARLEPEASPRNPLDILAQFVLSCAAMDDWDEKALFDVARRAAPFRDLSESDYGAVVAMLRGRYDRGRLPSLMPRLDRNAGEGTLRAKKSVLPLLYRSGGVIPDRGSYALRLADSRSPVGELDEEFVWERRLGDTFTLGTKAWRIVGIDERNVFVAPTGRAINIVPFWRAESQWRGEESMLGVLDLLDSLAEEPESRMREILVAAPNLDADSASALAGFLSAQRDAAALPGRKRAVLERFSGPDGQGRYAFLHTGRGGRVNAAIGIALRTVADQRYGSAMIDIFWDDEGIVAAFSRDEDETEIDIPSLLSELSARGLRAALRESLESSGLFGAAFRENAGRALLLPKADFGKRTPLWMTRLRSKRLYEEVRGFEDFPLVKETWRTCLEDILEPDAAERYLGDLVSGEVSMVSRESASPSPFAHGSVWIASDSFMYRRDEGMPKSEAGSDFLGELLASGESPVLDFSLAESLSERSRRTDPDYRPRDPGELADWLDERRILEWGQYEILLSVAASGQPAGSCSVPGTALRFRFPGATSEAALSPDVGSSPAADFDGLFSHWLRYEGAVSEAAVSALFGPSGSDSLHALAEAGAAAPLRLRGGAEQPGDISEFFCEAEFAARLFSAARSERRRRAEPLPEKPLRDLQAEAARRQSVSVRRAEQGRADIEEGVARLRSALEPILGLSAPRLLWEREILPSRLEYRPYYLELLIARSTLRWYGAGENRIGFSLEDELLYSDRPGGPPPSGSAELLASLRGGSAAAKPDAPGASIADLVWSGLATAPDLSCLDRLSEPRGQAPLPAARSYGSYRPKSAFPPRSRWERDRASSSRWTALPGPEAPRDAADASALLRERARRMLARFGVLSRSIAALEETSPPWPELFRALRLMELAGETVGGRFYGGLDELQFVFASDLSRSPSQLSGLYCLCARDPASLCGLQPLARELDLPPRAAGNHVVWNGSTLVLSSRSNGRDLSFRDGDADQRRAALSLLCRHLALRAVDPVRPLVAETVNGESAAHSPFAELFLSSGFVPALKGLEFIPGRIDG